MLLAFYVVYVSTVLTGVVYLQYQETIDEMTERIGTYVYPAKEPPTIEMTAPKLKK